MSEPTRLTEDDIRKLPRWPRAAFAVRCARRGAQAIVGAVPRDQKTDALTAFDKVLRLAEASCAEAREHPGLAEAIDSLPRFIARTTSPGSPAIQLDEQLLLKLGVTSAAEHAAKAVQAAAAGDDARCSNHAYDSYMTTIVQGLQAGLPDREIVLRKDYELLRQAAGTGKFTDDSPVWPQFYGLKKEAETYYRELPRLLAAGNDGKFVLIEGDRVIGIFKVREDGLRAGFDAFGFGSPFLVKQIQADEKPVVLHY